MRAARDALQRPASHLADPPESGLPTVPGRPAPILLITFFC